jgi:TonB-linked SusC/RagA family outer membrane protein
MNRFICTLVVLFSTIFISSVNAQEISGKVLDKGGVPLPGVNIVDETSKVSAVTDFDGNFNIKVDNGIKLTFSMIGYETVIAAAAPNMSVVMGEANKVLEEVVVIGYGTKKKGAITGSVSQLKSEEILKVPARSAIQSIQGKAAGVNIVANDEPGANPTIVIRGLGTILEGRTPLYVIDGAEASSLNGLSSNDIATIDILKDASSLAIYGQKGSNGVILITTKRGKKGDVKISYDSYFGEKRILKKVKMADSYRYAYFNNTALGDPTYYSFIQPVNTNWLDEITRRGEVTNNAVSIAGGGENVTYYLSLSHYTEKGILDGTEYKRTNIISRNDYQVSDRIKVTQSFNVSIANNIPKPLSAFTNAYKQSPIIPVRYPTGQFGMPLVNPDTGLNDISGNVMNNVGNPVAQLYYSHEKNRNLTLFGSLGAELQIIKDLKFNTNFGATADWGKGYTFTPNREIGLSQNPSLTAEEYAAIYPKEHINTLEQRRSDFFDWNWDNYLTYKKEFGNHDVTIVAGMSRSTWHTTEELKATRYDVPQQSNYWYLDLSEDNENVLPDKAIVNNHNTPKVSIAYFARLEYAFNDKYLLSGSIRKEGISVFQASKQWGIFPAVSVGWIMSKETFMNNIKFVNLLKLRGGYGEVGNGAGGDYNYISFLPNSYPFGDVSQPGTSVGFLPDYNLTWETMTEVDLGADFTIANNHISGTLDFYNRRSVDVKLNVQLPFVYSAGPTLANTGEITNKGIEVTLRWDDTIGDNFKYWIGGNFSQNKNEVSKITNQFFQNATGGDTGNGKYTKIVKLGDPIGSFYVFENIGYNSDGAPIYNDMVDGVPGLSDKDRVNAGSYIPEYTYGLNLGINYKNVDFSVDTYAVGGNKVYNGKKAQRFGGENIEYDILDSFWTPSTPNAENPKPSNEIPDPSTYFVEDGSFFRINNITLGYTFPKMIKSVDKVRLYVTAVNPFMFTKYTGYSPEISGTDSGNPLQRAGIELDAYPTNKTFLVGANITF